jgi:hypothetical protein
MDGMGKAHDEERVMRQRVLRPWLAWAAMLLASAATLAWWPGMSGQGPLCAEEPLGSAVAEPQLEPIVVGQPQRIDVFPPQVQIAGRRGRATLVVTGHYADGTVQDLTRAARFVVADPAVARTEGYVVYPAEDGQTEVEVIVGPQRVRVPVEVSRQAEADPVSFQFGVLPALTKQGCNSGACHGAPSGKGGFRLSLQAYDPALDRETLVREVFNRRTNVLQPQQSLLLRKPLGQVAHGGGQRLSTNDPAYRVLHDWIAEGLRLDADGAPHCVRLEVYPQQRTLLRPAHTQQLCVRAHFSDGTVRDVTDIATYSSSDDAVATVRPEGLVVGHERGEAAILVRYLEHVETAHMTFLADVPGFAWNDPVEHNWIDTLVFRKLRQMRILPSELCSDEEFVRRVYLDVLGILPTIEETQAFLEDRNPEKRARLIDELLQRPEFAEFWAVRWGDLLRVNAKKMSASGVHKFHRWLVQALRDNMPYHEFVAELLLAQGSTLANPPANYYRAAADVNDCTETTAQVFLGVRIQCAKCHNHPFERWTQDNYYGIAAFFNRVQRKNSASPDEMIVWMARSGEVTQPRTGQRMQPWLPGTGTLELAGEADRREAFVQWLQRPDNPLFAQVAVNRLWGHLFGRGIVEPVDDFRASNPPSHGELLEALARDFVEHGFDQKRTLRLILNSRTYQLSSRKNPFNEDDQRYFSHATTRMLSAEQLLDAICRVTGVPEKFPGLPAGTRATQLPSPDVNHAFLKVFGQPAREMACQCERSSESNLSQALQMINGPLVHAKLRDPSNRFRRALAAGRSHESIVRELYLAALCRQPGELELAAALEHIAASPSAEEALEDVCWALLNAKEFLFQH